MNYPKKNYYQISSLEKGIKILELLAKKKELTVSGVAEILGINRSGSHRFLATLRDLGYVEKNDEARYQLTFKVLELGMEVANRFEIRRVARLFMQELSSIYNENINLGYWDGKEIVHLDKILSLEILRTDPGIGTRAPAYCTGLGKAILAFLPPEEISAFLTTVKLQRFTPNTFTRKENLLAELKRTKERGFAIDNEELTSGLRCVAAPVFDYTGYPSYSISIAGPSIRITDRVIKRMQNDVRRVCHSLSTKLDALKIYK